VNSLGLYFKIANIVLYSFFKEKNYYSMCFFFILQSQRFEDAGASVGLTPSDVVGGSDITFSCVSDPQVAKDVSLYYLIFLYDDYLYLS